MKTFFLMLTGAVLMAVVIGCSGGGDGGDTSAPTGELVVFDIPGMT